MSGGTGEFSQLSPKLGVRKQSHHLHEPFSQFRMGSGTHVTAAHERGFPNDA